MNREDIRHMYESMHMPAGEKEEMYKEIVSLGRKRRKSPAAAVLLLSAAVLVILMSLPSFRAFAGEKIRMFSYYLLYGKDVFQAELAEKEISSPEALGPYVFGSLSEAEEAFGLAFLKSDDPSAESIPSGLFYQPVMIFDEKTKKHFAGMSFVNYAYASGDLQDIVLSPGPSPTVMDSISFAPGKEYASPIALQIRIITDRDLYESTFPEKSDLSAPQDRILENQAEIYELSSLDTKAMIVSTYAEEKYGIGPEVWARKGEPLTHITSAVLTCQGIEYSYFGDVSTDTMKKFLNTLHFY